MCVCVCVCDLSLSVGMSMTYCVSECLWIYAYVCLGLWTGRI